MREKGRRRPLRPLQGSGGVVDYGLRLGELSVRFAEISRIEVSESFESSHYCLVELTGGAGAIVVFHYAGTSCICSFISDGSALAL